MAYDGCATDVRSSELEILRRQTVAFIATDPFPIILIPRLRIQTEDGGYILTDQTPRVEQVFRTISMSANNLVTQGENGIQRTSPFMLLGAWDSLMQNYDYFTALDGQRWEVVSIQHDNGYERKGALASYGPLPR
jgi:hypothetical protein